MNLNGKVSIVTGAAQGIGQAIAEAMAMAGASVVVSDINLPKAQEVADDINKTKGKAIAVKTNVTSADEANQMVTRAIEAFGKVDILVNNAALTQLSFKTFVDTDEAEWRTHLDVTFLGTLHCCKAVLGPMIQQGRGRIVNLSSDAGKIGMANGPLYSAAKAAVSGFSRSLALDMATKGITVNCVSPGPVRTPTLMKALKELQAPEEMWSSMTPMERVGKPEEIAAMIVFLVSDQASFITGQDYSVDGGIRM